MGKTRITFFDTTKGLLMLLLVWGHMIIFAKSLGIESEFTPVIQNTVPFYRAFFMQTFFFITGYCTSWSISFKSTLFKNLKTIILPAFVFLPFTCLTRWIINDTTSLADFGIVFMEYLTDGVPWFLAALFITKLLYYTIRKFLHNYIYICILTILIFSIGLVARESGLPNNWYYQQSFLMLPFMFLGQYVSYISTSNIYIPIVNRVENSVLSRKSLWVMSIPYFGLIVLWQIMGMHLGFPAVDAIIDIHYKSAPFYIVFAFSGTALILVLSQYLQKYEWINLIGRQSLFVYLIHTVVVILLMKIYSMCFPISGFLNGAIFYLTIYLISILFLYFGCKLWHHKYLSWMLGKF